MVGHFEKGNAFSNEHFAFGNVLSFFKNLMMFGKQPPTIIKKNEFLFFLLMID
jgi:hypothetical protein